MKLARLFFFFLIIYPLVVKGEDLLSLLRRGDIDTARMLLENNILDPNHFSKPAENPLRQAIKKKDKSFVRLLLKYGANPNAVDSYGRPLLELTIRQRNPAMVQLLIEAGADINTEINSQPILFSFLHRKTGILLDISEEDIEILSMMINNGLKIQAKDIKNRTLLDYALEEYKKSWDTETFTERDNLKQFIDLLKGTACRQTIQSVTEKI